MDTLKKVIVDTYKERKTLPYMNHHKIFVSAIGKYLINLNRFCWQHQYQFTGAELKIIFALSWILEPIILALSVLTLVFATMFLPITLIASISSGNLYLIQKNIGIFCLSFRNSIAAIFFCFNKKEIVRVLEDEKNCNSCIFDCFKLKSLYRYCQKNDKEILDRDKTIVLAIICAKDCDIVYYKEEIIVLPINKARPIATINIDNEGNQMKIKKIILEENYANNSNRKFLQDLFNCNLCNLHSTDKIEKSLIIKQIIENAFGSNHNAQKLENTLSLGCYHVA